jgi:hypothetical protein
MAGRAEVVLATDATAEGDVRRPQCRAGLGAEPTARSGEEEALMCNLYSQTKGQQAILELTRATRGSTGNLPMQPGIFPDYSAPIVRNAPDGKRELTMARWGMPSSQAALLQSASRRAMRLEANGRTVDFKQVLRMVCLLTALSLHVRFADS